MGTWLETCVISHLPIPADTPTRLVLLVRSPDFDDGYAGYPGGGHALWTPWSLPILGTYNGYGRVDAPHSWHEDLILQRLQEDGEIRDGGDFEDRDDHDDHGLSRLQARVARGRVRVRADIDKEKPAVPMGLCFIRDDVYRVLADSPIYTETKVRTAQVEIDRFLDEVKETEVSPLHTGELNESIAAFAGTEFGDSLQKAFGNLKEYRRLAETTGGYGFPGIRGIGAYRLRIREWVMAGKPKDHPDVVGAATELGIFWHVLMHFERLRLLWGPQNGSGSQGTGWESHLVLARHAAAVALTEFEAEMGKYEDRFQDPSEP